MPETAAFHAGDSIVRTLAFTLAAGEEASRVTLLLTRARAQSEHPTTGRSRCIILEADGPGPPAPDAAIVPAAAVPAPRTRFTAQLRGVIPASICGGSYNPVFCIFAYRDGRAATGFEIDADQRFVVEVADDAASVDAGPSIMGFV
jgi:hypothetical protein